MDEAAITLLRAVGPTFLAAQARRVGVHWRDLYRLRDTGVVVELSRGLYRFTDAEPVSGLDLIAVSRRMPAGTICLVSALAHWDLTDERPDAVDVAVPRGRTRPAIGCPPTRVHVFDVHTFDLGRLQIELAPGEAIAISSPERAVVDVFRQRARLGTGLAYQALREYLSRPRAQPGTVVRIAERLRVAGPVRHASRNRTHAARQRGRWPDHQPSASLVGVRPS